MRTTLLALAYCSGLLTTAARAEPRFAFREPVQPPRPVHVIAERGLRMLAPENSIAAVRECAADFIEWAAVDVRRTSDGQHVVIHDDAVAVNQRGRRVSELTLEQIRTLDTGARFAPRYQESHPVTLPELFAAVGPHVNLVLRCEGTDAALLVREIRDAKMHTAVVIAGSRDFLHQVHTIAGTDIAVQASWQPRETSLEALITECAPAVVELAAADVTADRCRDLHSHNIRVHTNALGNAHDRSETWTHVLDAGVDAVLTDNPAGVRFCEVRRRIPRFPVEFACHRGASRYAPENTLPAIEIAADLGADYIEIDIRTTSDGKFVLLHDRTLDRTTNGIGPVAVQTSSAVAALDAGSWFGAPFAELRVPSFDDGLIALGPQAHAYLDAKDIAPESLLAAIRDHGLMQRHAVYQSVDYCRRLKALDSNVRIQPPLRSPDDLNAVIEISPYCVDASWSILSPELIDRCHAAKILVHSDALGSHETLADYRRAINWGIDLIQTDFPLRVLRAIELEAEPNDKNNRR